jgi:prepilin-type N-terminal cleavage/methylation domain-containing protein
MKNRHGFTLLESLVALTLLSALIGVTLAGVDRQVRLFSHTASQSDALQNMRFAMSQLELSLPTAGTNLPLNQPFLVYADSEVVAFNADYVSNVAGDPFAVYVDTASPLAYATAVTRARRFTIPRSAVQYPDTNYVMGALNSPGETIIFYFTPDSTTTRTNDYLLFRKVNDQPPDLLARNLFKRPGFRFFTYQKRIAPAIGVPFFQAVPVNQLPLRHTRPLHLAVNDTGALSRIDSVRAVAVNFMASDNRGAQERFYASSRVITMPNAGIAAKRVCGDEPLAVGALIATPVLLNGTDPGVELAWNASTDEAGGERDVERYLVYKSVNGVQENDPFVSIPSGLASYVYTDAGVVTGDTYRYTIVAQDCTPTVSNPTQSNSVVP